MSEGCGCSLALVVSPPRETFVNFVSISAELGFGRLAEVGGFNVPSTHLVNGKVKVDCGHDPVSKLFVDDALQPLRARTGQRVLRVTLTSK